MGGAGQEESPVRKRLGLNLLAGVSIDLGPIDEFVQGRITVADGFHLSLTSGAMPTGH